MIVTYHRLVQHDVNRILKEYDAASPRLGDEFWTELKLLIEAARKNPQRFHFVTATNFRRANLNKFPYHFLYKVLDDKIRVLVVRHNRRNPKLGTKRK